jgi:hypothetical protein
LHADVHDARVEELDLVHANDLHADLDARQQLVTRGDRERLEATLVARHDFIRREAVIEDRLEHLHPLPRDHGAPQAADELLRLSGEHASGNDFDPAAAMMIQG